MIFFISLASCAFVADLFNRRKRLPIAKWNQKRCLVSFSMLLVDSFKKGLTGNGAGNYTTQKLVVLSCQARSQFLHIRFTQASVFGWFFTPFLWCFVLSCSCWSFISWKCAFVKLPRVCGAKITNKREKERGVKLHAVSNTYHAITKGWLFKAMQLCK